MKSVTYPKLLDSFVSGPGDLGEERGGSRES